MTRIYVFRNFHLQKIKNGLNRKNQGDHITRIREFDLKYAHVVDMNDDTTEMSLKRATDSSKLDEKLILKRPRFESCTY